MNLAARGEQWRGGGIEVSDFVFLAFGTGVGMGIVANGHLVRGARGAAGEISYLPVGGDPYDPRGFELGTFESAVGSAAIAARYAHAGGAPGRSVREIFEALGRNEDAAIATVEALTVPAGIYHLVDDTPLPMNQWLPAFARLLSASAPQRVSEADALRVAGPDAVYYQTKLRGASNAKAKKAFGFRPRRMEWLDS